MDVRIGVTQAPREISVELGDDTDRDALKASIDKAIAAGEGLFWLTDKKGREVAVPVAKIAYVELGATDNTSRIGFGS